MCNKYTHEWVKCRHTLASVSYEALGNQGTNRCNVKHAMFEIFAFKLARNTALKQSSDKKHA